ncbi:MAG: hypothetical protein ACK500_06500 [Flavobacteriales bacterium]|jgi:hypothetical protein
MKLIRFVLFAFFLCAGSAVMAQNTVSAENVNVTINGTTTREALAELRMNLEQVGIRFWYEPSFDGNRQLLGIRYQLTDIATGAVIGVHEMHNFNNPTVKTTFRIGKTGSAWTAECVGTCND